MAIEATVVQIPKDDLRTETMTWIGNLLQTLANSGSVRISSWQWQLDDMDNEKTIQLVVVGSRGKRAIKSFTIDELDRCLSDRELQSEIHLRLTRLVSFLGGRDEPHSAKKAARKRQ